MNASELAELLGSKVENGNEKLELSGISTLDEATADQVAFLTDRKYLRSVAQSRAGVVLVSEKLAPLDRPYIPLKNVWAGVLEALKLFYPGFERRTFEGIHQTAVIDATAKLAADVTVGPCAVIGAQTQILDGCYIGPGVVIGTGCRIGRGCTIYANAVLESDTVLGAGVVVQPGAVLGGDGFKYEMLDGTWTRIPQVGHVELGDYAEVGANSCIDRASYSATRIAEHTKIDNLVQIGHNVQVGRNCAIVALSGIAGSSKVGDYCILAAQSGMADNVSIGDRVVLMARAGVTVNIGNDQTLLGMPAKPFRQEAQIIAARKKLPELVSQMSELTRRIEELEAMLAAQSKDDDV